MKILVAGVDNFRKVIPINEKEKYYFKKNINKRKLIFQHKSLIKTIEKIKGIEIDKIELLNELPEQTFVRDNYFQIGENIFVGNFKCEIRKKEIEPFTKYLESKKYKYIHLQNEIEGGDVIVNEKNIFIGLNNRTSINAINELKEYVGDSYNIIPLYLKKGILHLDCVLGIIDNTYAFLYKNGLEKESVDLLNKYFTIIDIFKKEFDNMGTNFLKINNVIISNKKVKRINEILKKLNYIVYAINFSEFFKLGGAIRCCTCTIEEKNKYKNYLQYVDGELFYRNVNLTKIIKNKYFPLNVIYTNSIKDNIYKLKNSFDYAINEYGYKGKYIYANANKANYRLEVLVEAFKYSDVVEVSSYLDLKLTKRIIDRKKYYDKKIICNGIKDYDYLNLIIKMNKNYKIINIIDSIEEFRTLNKILDDKMEIGVRINISNLYRKKTSLSLSDRFGFNRDQLDAFINEIDTKKFKFTCIHFHQRTSDYFEEKEAKNIMFVFEKYYVELKKRFKTLKYFDIGGGCPYDKMVDFNYNLYSKKIIKNIKTLCLKNNIEEPDIIQENGRYTTSDCEFSIYKVIQKKETIDTWYVINGSFIKSIPNSWALNEKYLILPIKLVNDDFIDVKLAGCTCDCDDVYYYQQNEKISLPNINKNQLYIGIFGRGAYQDIISGMGGVHHCLTPNEAELFIYDKKLKTNLKYKKKSQNLKDILKKN